ncbi:MAG: hypothetical protein M1833_000317 [Piccolia ochrophora]|nr:MAG: hypothetical protein M1833_000317 [Piccolia ochrophora]
MYQVADMEQDVDVIGPHNGQDDGDKRHQEGVSSDSADTAEDLPSSDEDYSSFSKAEKRYIVFIVAWAAFFSPLSANIYFPALNILSSDLHVSLELMNLTITSYMICQGIIPSILGDLADTSGRRPVYLLAFIVYLAANIGLAIQDSYPALLVLRMLQSTGSAGTIAVGYGVATDIASPAERGKYLGAMLCG